MADAPQNFTDMFKNLGEQLKIAPFDMTKIMEHQQKNLEAMTKSWQAMAGGANEIARKQREILEAAVKDVTAMVQEYKPGGSPQDIMAKQAEFAKKAMEAAIANTRDIAELVQKSTTEAFKIVQDRMKDSYEEIRTSVEKKMWDFKRTAGLQARS
jgi:phasin family protein